MPVTLGDTKPVEPLAHQQDRYRNDSSDACETVSGRCTACAAPSPCVPGAHRRREAPRRSSKRRSTYLRAELGIGCTHLRSPCCPRGRRQRTGPSAMSGWDVGASTAPASAEATSREGPFRSPRILTGPITFHVAREPSRFGFVRFGPVVVSNDHADDPLRRVAEIEPERGIK